MPPANRESPENPQLRAARGFWFGTYQGMLSTHSAALPNYPFGSLVPICREHNGLPLLLLSHLAQHTQNLISNPHCSLMLLEPGHGDIQQLGRLTCLARAEELENVTENLSQRYFRYFPGTREYYENLNFRFYQLIPERFYFIGGFGSARWIDPSRLLTELTFTPEEEADLLTQMQLRPLFQESREEHLSPVGVDCHGLDLISNNQLSRIMFSEPAATPEQFLEQLRKPHCPPA